MTNLTTSERTRRESIQPGARLTVALMEPGGAVGREVGTVSGFVLNAGAVRPAYREFDLILNPAEYATEDAREELDHMLFLCDLTLDDLREGPVYVLRNCQPEWVR